MRRGPNVLRTACITVLGAGFGPFVPGTWGSLVALILYALVWWIAAATKAPRPAIEAITVAGILTAGVLSVRWGEWAIQRFGSSDPKPFTLDEFAGQWVALLFLPLPTSAGLWPFACVVGGQFVLFRVFDILKAPPARQAERLPAGWGILTDDLFAGLYANVLGQLFWRLAPVPVWLSV